ncbi:MAG: hypothetical protein MR550_01755 [Bacilli bacterium]|nr:hypothetical protein [Bacilli bacterium]
MLKHDESLTDKEKVKLDLYKILRMSVLLSQDEVDELTLSKFKDASINLDKMYTEDYEEKLESMFYNTSTLEEEVERLKKLVEFIKDRIEQRKSLQSDYKNVTNKELNDLEYIEKSSELDIYEKRLDLIKSYLDNSRTIEVNKKELTYLEDELSNEFDKKKSNEEKNINLEDKLYTDYINTLYEMDLQFITKVEDIGEELNKIAKEINEAKDQKDTFVTAFDNLKTSGISGDLELEYASYVENSKRNYYYVKEKEILLELYELIEKKEKEYSNLFTKRTNVKTLLKERLTLRKEMNIKEKDLLLPIYDLVEEQSHEIEEEKSNTDNINVLTERIKLKENRLEELNKEVKRPEVLSILKEFHLIDTYEHDDESLDKDYLFEDEKEEQPEQLEDLVKEDILETEPEIEESKTDSLFKDLMDEANSKDEDVEETQEVEPLEETYLPNQIKSSEMIMSMNFGLSRLKSISVMKRVADMLGIDTKKKDPEPVVKEEPKQIETNEDLFWTPTEFAEMKSSSEEPQQEVKLPLDDLFKDNTSKEEVKQENTTTVPEMKKEDNIFEKEQPSDIFSNNKSNDIFEKEQPNNIFETNKQNDIFNNNINNSNVFETNNGDGNMIFPEPIMPTIEEKKLPVDNDSDKFKWPDNSNLEKFDLNGIFPN